MSPAITYAAGEGWLRHKPVIRIEEAISV